MKAPEDPGFIGPVWHACRGGSAAAGPFIWDDGLDCDADGDEHGTLRWQRPGTNTTTLLPGRATANQPWADYPSGTTKVRSGSRKSIAFPSCCKSDHLMLGWCLQSRWQMASVVAGGRVNGSCRHSSGHGFAVFNDGSGPFQGVVQKLSDGGLDGGGFLCGWLHVHAEAGSGSAAWYRASGVSMAISD
jgi:hypothetical protein